MVEDLIEYATQHPQQMYNAVAGGAGGAAGLYIGAKERLKKHYEDSDQSRETLAAAGMGTLGGLAASGLAEGIDTVSHSTSLIAEGATPEYGSFTATLSVSMGGGYEAGWRAMDRMLPESETLDESNLEPAEDR